MNSVEKAVETFEQRSQANLSAINNIVDAARGQQEKAFELLTSLSTAEQRISEHTRRVEAAVNNSVSALDHKVNTTVAALAAQKLTKADEQLVASTLKLEQAADRLRAMLRGTLVALVIVIVLVAVAFFLLIPRKSAIDQRRAELSKLDNEIAVKEALVQATISQCDGKPCIRVRPGPDYTRTLPDQREEAFRVIWLGDTR